MKLNDLVVGKNKLVCLRIDIRTCKMVVINLTVCPCSGNKFEAQSDSLDKYTFYRNGSKEINGLRICLDTGNENQDFNELEEYLFETLEDCREFAIEYCSKKNKNI